MNHLSAVSKVVNSKNTITILDNFLFDLKGEELVITGSDLTPPSECPYMNQLHYD